MSGEYQLSVGNFNALKVDQEKTQKDVADLRKDFEVYKSECATDRQQLKSNVDKIVNQLSAIEKKTDAQTPMIEAVFQYAKGIMNSPAIKGAFVTLVLAMLGYMTWAIQSKTEQQKNQPQQVRVINPSSSSVIVIDKP